MGMTMHDLEEAQVSPIAFELFSPSRPGHGYVMFSLLPSQGSIPVGQVKLCAI